jgi:hypothetical protein
MSAYAELKARQAVVWGSAVAAPREYLIVVGTRRALQCRSGA